MECNLDRSRLLNFTVRRGDTIDHTIPVKNEDGTDFDFTGYTATFKVYTSVSDPTANLELTVTLAAGSIRLQKDAATMENIRNRGYIFRMVMTKDGNVEQWLNGLFRVKEEPGEGPITDVGDLVISLNGTPVILTIVIGGTGGGGSAAVFESDIQVSLAPGKSFGRWVNGDTIPAEGKTANQVIEEANDEYIDPAFTSWLMRNAGDTGTQSTTVESGTTLSGVRRFTWAIILNSGIVDTINIHDETADTDLVTGTLNDGSHSVDIGSHQLNGNGSTYSWRGVANDTGTDPDQEVDSNLFTVTSRYTRFYGPVVSAPSNSAEVRALSSSEFQVGNVEVFNLLTGTVRNIFAVGLPPGRTITSVIDLDALNANITADYVLVGTINVLDAGGTNRAYNVYVCTNAVAYSTNHRHQITTA